MTDVWREEQQTEAVLLNPEPATPDAICSGAPEQRCEGCPRRLVQQDPRARAVRAAPWVGLAVRAGPGLRSSRRAARGWGFPSSLLPPRDRHCWVGSAGCPPTPGRGRAFLGQESWPSCALLPAVPGGMWPCSHTVMATVALEVPSDNHSDPRDATFVLGEGHGEPFQAVSAQAEAALPVWSTQAVGKAERAAAGLAGSCRLREGGERGPGSAVARGEGPQG